MPWTNRLLFVVLSVVAIVSIAVIGLGFWFLIRPQAQRSGRLAAPVAQAVRIARDLEGVPHIQAASVADAVFAQGFVHAQDRLFQMDLARRQAAGELAEVWGAEMVQSDVAMRNLRLRHIAEMHLANLPSEERQVLTAYTKGVNYFIDTHRSRLPVELIRLQYRPAAWKDSDSVLGALSMAFAMTNTWRDEVARQALTRVGDPAKIGFLYPDRVGGELLPGSNAWAVAGRLTSSGKPLLANDPHLSLSLPGLWYANHLQAPGLNVTGVSLPGVPLVICGHNERIAWGITNLQADVQDVHEEQSTAAGEAVAPSAATARARAADEPVRVRAAPPVTVAVRSAPSVQADPSRRLILRWSIAEPGFRLPLLALNQASSWQEFRAAVADWKDPPQNFVYADVDDNIGYQVGGRLPIRSGDPGVNAGTNPDEWTGFIPFDDLPSSLNPASGMAITSNQNPFTADYKYIVHGSFAPPYRAGQIAARLSAHTGLQPSHMMTIQRDVYSPFLHFLAGEVVRAFRGRESSAPLLMGTVQLLSDWDGQMLASRAAPLVITLVADRVRVTVADRAAPGHGATYDSQMAPALIERLLRDRPSDWFSDYDEMVRRATLEALDAGAMAYGRDPAAWRLGHVQAVRLSNPVFGGWSILRGRLGWWTRIPPTELDGSLTSVNQVTPRLAPSMRMVIDLGDLDRSLLTLPTGQSGQMLSPHYKDHWPAYIRGEGLPMRFYELGEVEVLMLTPQSHGQL
jgi:penicillin G amidase